MSRALPALYLAILAVFVAAGSLLSSRTEAVDVTAGLPERCSQVPDDLVRDLFPDAETTSEQTIEDDARYGRWLDGDGELLVELRCTRFGLSELGPYRDALAAAEAGRATKVPTEPPAILAAVPDGVTIRQLDEGTGRSLTWFVRDDLAASEAEAVVLRTRAWQDDAPAEGA
ncbi:MAG: hypothetical protein KY461_05055 [Actinobacteria bacterium]|nr:hypothetical protein [Actinomycetota bacterium]